MLSRVNTRLILATKKMARKRINNDVPTFDELLVPTIKALHELGGSGSMEEINSKVYVLAEISDETLQVPHGEEGTVSEVDYRLA
jgi:restriction system protein